MGDVTSPYEHIPQRVGHDERDAAVQRLRANLDEGRLDQATFDERAAAAFAATTQDDLDPLFEDLPPVATSGTFELYPHQTIAPVPSPYRSDPVPYEGSSLGRPSGQQFPGFSPLLGVIIVAVIVATAMGFMFAGGFPFWMFFIIPVVVWNKRRMQNRRFRQRDE